MQVELLYDMPRLEEKLMIESFRSRGVEVNLTNVNTKPLLIGEASSEVALIRVVSMMKALYSAAVREAAGARAINSSSTLMLCGDKILTLSRLKARGLRVPRSMVVMDVESAELAYRQFPKPFVDKPPIGSWGRLVTLVRDVATWRSVLEHRQMMQSQQLRTHIVQEYIESGGRDIRAIIIGGEVIGAVVRKSVGDEWRSNVALGGKTEPIKVNGDIVEIGVKAAETVGGDFISIDILEDGKRGRLYLNEVNGVPEFKGFMEATGINVADMLAKYVISVMRR
ncbi:MAG: lysine biosynthesis protein LysX [Nitrososphaerota archaeon]|nr:lysine biosynthesis protein LysX [Candidatus Calditenuaceae archaeon]MDW8073564.1 lysine biosynthesis protein LysX [Nitrososphaerota archaeon]